MVSSNISAGMIPGFANFGKACRVRSSVMRQTLKIGRLVAINGETFGWAAHYQAVPADACRAVYAE